MREADKEIRRSVKRQMRASPEWRAALAYLTRTLYEAESV